MAETFQRRRHGDRFQVSCSLLADQFDLPDGRRGVVQVIPAMDVRIVSDKTAKVSGERPEYDNSRKALWWPPSGETIRSRPQRLDPATRYALKAYAGQVEPTLAPGVGCLHFPMVHKIGRAADMGLPDSATGRELVGNGLAVKVGASPRMIWIAYRRSV